MGSRGLGTQGGDPQTLRDGSGPSGPSSGVVGLTALSGNGSWTPGKKCGQVPGAPLAQTELRLGDYEGGRREGPHRMRKGLPGQSPFQCSVSPLPTPQPHLLPVTLLHSSPILGPQLEGHLLRAGPSRQACSTRKINSGWEFRGGSTCPRTPGSRPQRSSLKVEQSCCQA